MEPDPDDTNIFYRGAENAGMENAEPRILTLSRRNLKEPCNIKDKNSDARSSNQYEHSRRWTPDAVW